jgi:hypothetical protein
MHSFFLMQAEERKVAATWWESLSPERRAELQENAEKDIDEMKKRSAELKAHMDEDKRTNQRKRAERERMQKEFEMNYVVKWAYYRGKAHKKVISKVVGTDGGKQPVALLSKKEKEAAEQAAAFGGGAAKSKSKAKPAKAGGKKKKLGMALADTGDFDLGIETEEERAAKAAEAEEKRRMQDSGTLVGEDDFMGGDLDDDDDDDGIDMANDPFAAAGAKGDDDDDDKKKTPYQFERREMGEPRVRLGAAQKAAATLKRGGASGRGRGGGGGGGRGGGNNRSYGGNQGGEREDTSKVLCRFIQQGSCQYGNRCHYYHPGGRV